MDPTSWIVWVIAALVTGFIAFHLLAYATKMLKAGELAAISYQETIMASLLGLLLFGEVLTTFQLIGGGLIILGGVSQIFFSTNAANKQPAQLEVQAAGAIGAGPVDGDPLFASTDRSSMPDAVSTTEQGPLLDADRKPARAGEATAPSAAAKED